MTVARNFSGHTISRGTDYTDALALSIVGCIQPKKLLRLLNEMEKGLEDDGLLQRFIWIWPQQPSFESFESLSESIKVSNVNSFTLNVREKFISKKTLINFITL